MPKETQESPSAKRLLARLAVPRPSGGGLESLGPSELESGPPLLDARERLGYAERVLRNKAAAAPDVDEAVIDRMIRDAEEALRKLEGEGPSAQLADSEAFGLEAVIEADGSRPVLFVQYGRIDVNTPDLADSLAVHWQGAAASFIKGIEKVVAAVGGVQLPAFDNKRVGTAFAIAPGFVLTNRHVLEEIAVFNDGAWKWRYEAEVDFAGEYQLPGEKRFALEEVTLWGPNAINRRLNFANLDLAVIRVRDSGAEFPKPLSFEGDLNRVRVHEGRQPPIYVVGFPAKPLLARGEPSAGAPAGGQEYQEVIEKLYENRFGSKRWAPGLVEAGAGQLAGDERKWVMSHDASTLGGNSGSCVVDFASNGERVVGLHFGGRPRVENYAHVVAALQQELGAINKVVWI